MQRRTLLLSLPLAMGGPALGLAAGTDTEDRPEQPKGYPVSLAQMQQAVAKRFPRRYPVQGLLDLDLQTPRLHLLPEQNRLRAEMAVAAAGPALNRVHQGSFDVDFALRYEPSDRTLRAHQLRLARLTFPTLPARATEMINLYAPTLADQSLREVIGELNAYLPQPVLLAPEVAELKLTGSFPSDQPQKLLDALPRILPVRVSERQGRVALLPR